MADIKLPITQEQQILEPRTVVTSITKVASVYFDFARTKCHIFVEYGDEVDGVFTPIDYKEIVVSGAYYMSKVLVVPNNTTPMVAQFIGMLSGVVAEIHADTVLRDGLLASGELEIKEDTSRGTNKVIGLE